MIKRYKMILQEQTEKAAKIVQEIKEHELSDQQKAQHQQLMAYIDEQVKAKLLVYNLDVQRILQASDALKSLHHIVEANEMVTGHIVEANNMITDTATKLIKQLNALVD